MLNRVRNRITILTIILLRWDGYEGKKSYPSSCYRVFQKVFFFFNVEIMHQKKKKKGVPLIYAFVVWWYPRATRSTRYGQILPSEKLAPSHFNSQILL